MTAANSVVVQVVGDATVDWLVVAPPAPALKLPDLFSRATTGVYAQSGGSALLAEVLGAVLPAGSVAGGGLTERMLTDPRCGDVTRTFTLWEPKERELGGTEVAWRMREFIGVEGLAEGCAPPTGSEPDRAPECLVIDDTNLGFRNAESVWPACLRDAGERAHQVIVKMTNRLGDGLLWHALVGSGDALTVYCSLGDLRKEEAHVGQALSWGQLTNDVVGAVRAHSELTRASRVIVSCGPSGAVVVESTRAWVLFDPACQERDWEERRPGDTLGLGTCVVAALTHEAVRDGATDWMRALALGLAAARLLHEQGYGVEQTSSGAILQFPVDAIAGILNREPDDRFQHREVPDDPSWTILGETRERPLEQVAHDIAMVGSDHACRGIPVERMGSWSSVDRSEIEGMRSVRNIIRGYLESTDRPRPLSVAVFGQPGSGKSFAIKQMAREWTDAGSALTVLPECNLSQLRGPDDLVVPFQRLRDCAVEGKLPLIFWDEFDARLGEQELGWLVHFLAPMQDGKFVERGVAQPLGPAIFVFAGGTCSTMAEFEAKVETMGSFVKARDFVSRLRGYVDIMGPNGDDKARPLRRALLLRSLIERRWSGLLRDKHDDEGNRIAKADVDPGVLRAFLDIERFEHGSRSMEALFEMSALQGKTRFERSLLPAKHQLDLHVDAGAFMALVRAEPAVPSST